MAHYATSCVTSCVTAVCVRCHVPAPNPPGTLRSAS